MRHRTHTHNLRLVTVSTNMSKDVSPQLCQKAVWSMEKNTARLLLKVCDTAKQFLPQNNQVARIVTTGLQLILFASVFSVLIQSEGYSVFPLRRFLCCSFINVVKTTVVLAGDAASVGEVNRAFRQRLTIPEVIETSDRQADNETERERV